MKSGIPNTTQSGRFDYQEIFDAYPDAVFVLSPEGRILRANQTAIHRYGYGLSELQRMHVKDLATPDMRERVPVHLAKAQHTGDKFEWKHRRRDGSELPVEIDARPIMQFGSGAILACVRDISGQEALQRASEGQKHLLERTLDTEPGTVYIFDLLEQRNLYINRHWLDAYGYTAEETQAMGGELMSRIFHQDDLPSIAANHAAWRQAVDGEMRSIEYRVRDKTGGWHWLMSRETPFSRDAGGKVSQILGIAHDVTERKMGELLLNGQNRVLEMVAAGAELQASLSELVLMVEKLSPGMLGSILLLDKDGIHLHHGAAPSLPREYVTAIDGKAIGPRAGSCGTAAYHGETVCTEDIATDPLWEEYREAALPHGLRACWSSPIFDAQQRVLGTFAMYYAQPGLPEAHHLRLVDIVTHTAAIAIIRHHAEDALERSESRFRQITGSIQEVFWMSDSAKTEMLYVSPAYEKVWGRSCQSLYNHPRSFLDAIHPEDRDRVAAAIAQQSMGEYDEQYRILRPDGSLRWIHDRAVPVRNQLGEVYRIAGVAEDITRRKQAELQVQRLNRFYAALSSTNEAIVRVGDAASLFRRVCDIAVRDAGFTLAWIGKADGEWIEVIASAGPARGYLEGLRISVRADLQEGQGPSGRVYRSGERMICNDFLHSDITRPWSARAASFGISASAVFPLFKAGNVYAILNIYTGEMNIFQQEEVRLLDQMAVDISFALDHLQQQADLQQAKVELEDRVRQRTEQLEVAKARAEKADRLKSAFLATMSHELRTPLNSIIGFTGILLQQLPGSLNNEQMKQMTIVKQASNHLLALINDVLDISKVEAGELKLQFRKFELTGLLSRISALFEAEARRRGVRLLLERSADRIEFTGDERRIEQVLNNLLSNALKFTREGTIRLSCTQTQSGVSISVSDTGIGIKAEDMDKLFQPFSRINAVERQAYEGTGLGLAITRHLVEGMGGRVAAESQWGKGSRFTITLPKATTDNE